jgi:hypothetical protein
MNRSRLRAFGFSSKPWAGISLFLLTFLVYLKTLAPGVFGFDSAELATGVFTQGIVHPPGYPLYLLIGKLFTFLPIRDVAYRLNLMSACFSDGRAVVLCHWEHHPKSTCRLVRCDAVRRFELLLADGPDR